MRRNRSRAPDYWEDTKGKPRRRRRTGLILPLLIALAFIGLYTHADQPASGAATPAAAAPARAGAGASFVASRALAAGGSRTVVVEGGAAAAPAAAPASAPQVQAAKVIPVDPADDLPDSPAWPPLPAESVALIRTTLRDQVATGPPPPGAPRSERRRLAVRAAMAHAWAGYVRYAWGADELAPVSKRGYETFCSLGATLVDALDTLKLMGFDGEFERARAWVGAGEAGGLSFDRDCSVSAFEATIRVVGGLLAAADLDPASKPVFVPRAEELAARLLKAYDTPLGFPRSSINLRSGQAATPGWIGGGQAALLAEVGTVQLELLKLAEATGKAAYADAAERIVANLAAAHPDAGLLPIYVSLADASAAGPLTQGGMSDSYYEYLLKAWLLKGKDGPKASLYKDMWVRAMDDTLDRLVATHPADGRVYVGERATGDGPLIPKMEHLACFLPANLALGVLEGAVTGEKAARYTAAAKGLTETCYRMYATTATGLAPEHVTFNGAEPMAPGRSGRFNLLRPEAVEALVMLHRLTGDPTYQDWGWAMFAAFERVARVPSGGYSGVQDVSATPGAEKVEVDDKGVPVAGGATPVALNDRQESFWLAETLKYFYLLFAPADALPLAGPGAWVLNTEAHPLKPLSPASVKSLTNDMSAAALPGVLARLSPSSAAPAKPVGAAPAGKPGAVLTRPQGGEGGGAAAAAAKPAGGNPTEGGGGGGEGAAAKRESALR